jgi:hypothetical protein
LFCDFALHVKLITWRHDPASDFSMSLFLILAAVSFQLLFHLELNDPAAYNGSLSATGGKNTLCSSPSPSHSGSPETGILFLLLLSFSVMATAALGGERGTDIGSERRPVPE